MSWATACTFLLAFNPHLFYFGFSSRSLDPNRDARALFYDVPLALENIRNDRRMYRQLDRNNMDDD